MNSARCVFFRLALIFLLPLGVHAADRPNFVWILSEDNSKHFLKLFDSGGAPAPNIEKLAASGLTFDRAFSCSPVCSVARTTLMTGIYAPRIGTQFHRKLKPVQLPPDWMLWPSYLRTAGYYTSNNSKTDYNTAGNESAWDESSNDATWRKRPKNMPFFHMQTFGQSHESSLHFTREEMEQQPTETDPQSVRLAPYHPDTPTFRYTYARYHDRIQLIDEKVGELVAKLEEDGLLADTFIFYFGDHGGVLPGSKGYTKETGLHVPLVVRIPENWKHLVDANAGSRIGGFVSFVDFGPTVLHLAGVRPMDYLDGTPFLGEDVEMTEVEQRDEAFGYADRFDEKYDQVRTLRKGRYKYVRNFTPYYPDSLQNNYRYRMLAYQEWRRLHEEGKLNSVQNQFFQPKPAEALYDLETDPYEVNNLAVDPDYQGRLIEMRERMIERLLELPDLSLYPESHLVEQAMHAPLAFAKNHERHIEDLLEIANLQLEPFNRARRPLERAMESNDPWKRYWALTVCAAFGERALPLADQATGLLRDPHPLVQVRAIEFLGGMRAKNPERTLMQVLETSDSPAVSLLAMNAAVYLRDMPNGYHFPIKREDVRSRNGEVDRRLDYWNR